jgi:hypothetical protein
MGWEKREGNKKFKDQIQDVFGTRLRLPDEQQAVGVGPIFDE